ncbi:receptor-type guanylate cyclase gcy-12-like, partial [Penaeus japonicus]|uniref:receptor-type guanylate cyclase gcy-12-like n=1 Tax=Penaeus japonicus TaxID=27405 RepID=UPI001C711CF2
SNLSRVYANTDRVVVELPTWPVVSRKESDLFESPQHFQIRLKDFRDQLDVSDTMIHDKIDFYTAITTPLIKQLTLSTSTTNTPGLWQLLEAYKSIIQALENLGRSAIFGLYYYGRGHLDQGSLFQYVRFWTIAHSGIKTSGGFSTSGKDYLEVLRSRDYMRQIRGWNEEIRENAFINGSVEVADEYLQAMGRYMQDLRKMQTRLRDEIQSTVRRQLKGRGHRNISIAVLVLVLSISPVIILLVRKATYMVQVFSDTLADKMNQLKVEKKRSDRLLYQMLPVVVAKQLRQNKQVPAESFESATVYFSDIVGFEELCADSSPLQIVQLLNMQYRVFDSRLEQYEVYKVETIGDAYMVVSGLPKRIGHRHAEEIACMALDLRHSVQSIPIPHKPGQWLQIRAGVNTGPVVAGVVGTKMPRYCLFGDTVNTASRMETTCDPMRIQISLSTRMALFSAGGFIMEFRGYVDVKGKGEMSTYWLEGRDGLQLQDVNLAGTSADGDGISNPAFLHMVDDLHDSPEQKQVEKAKK